MEQKLRVGLIGISHWHFPLYVPGLENCEIVGTYDEDPEVALKYAKQFRCPAYQEYRTLVREARPDFVFAFAPHYRMKEIAAFLLEAGIPLSMEKPAGLNSREVEELAELCERKSGFCSIPFVWRWSDTVNDLKEKYLKTGIRHMSFRFIAGPPSRYIVPSPWMLSKKTAGGGCMTNLGVHFIDMAMYLTDTSDAEVLASSYQYGRDYDIETYATSLLRMPTGASLLLESGYAYPMSEESKRENRWTVVTEDGYYILAENRLQIREENAEPAGISLNTDSDVYYAIYTKAVLENVKNGSAPRAGLKEMLDVSRVLDRMNEAAGR